MNTAYWLNGQCFCDSCVEGRTPCLDEIEIAQAIRSPAAGKCACCGARFDEGTPEEIPSAGPQIRFSADGHISIVWDNCEPVRCPTQHDMDTLPVGLDLTDDEIEQIEE